MKIDENALKVAAKKLRRLRLTSVGGRKEHPAETVVSVFENGLGGMYDDEAIAYTLRHGIQYYLSAQQGVQRTATPHEHLQAEFDYICVGCGDLVKRRR